VQVGQGVDQTKFNVVGIDYPASVPFNTSVAKGVTALNTAIADINEDYVLVGYSQGAMVTSNVAKASSPAALIGAVTFGNPERQAGHTFPNCPDPGGHGIMSAPNLWTNTPSWWWDFAPPSDLAACVTNSLTGQWLTAIFEAACESFNGNQQLLINTILKEGANPLGIIPLIAQVLPYISPNISTQEIPHTSYARYVPPVPGNTLTAVQLAINYINSLAD
jgi:hypothetical protein